MEIARILCYNVVEDILAQDEDKNKHNTTQRMGNLDTSNIRNTRHRTKTKINTTQHREWTIWTLATLGTRDTG